MNGCPVTGVFINVSSDSCVVLRLNTAFVLGHSPFTRAVSPFFFFLANNNYFFLSTAMRKLCTSSINDDCKSKIIAFLIFETNLCVFREHILGIRFYRGGTVVIRRKALIPINKTSICSCRRDSTIRPKCYSCSVARTCLSGR